VDTSVLEESAAFVYRVDLAILKMEAAGFSQMLIPIHEAMKYHTPEDCNLVMFIFSYSL
jgi:hypothetical protein